MGGRITLFSDGAKLARLFGTPLSRGSSALTVLRAASRCELVFEGIPQAAGQSDWVAPDENSWRVGGHPARLHALVGPEATAYVIDPTRSGGGRTVSASVGHRQTSQRQRNTPAS
jgi:hypothetical protein